MKKLYLLFFGVVLFSGCLIPEGIIKPELTLLKAAQDVNAVKVQGEVSALKDASLKLADKIDQQNSAIAGFGNTINKVENTVGRDMNSGNKNEKEIYIAQLNNQKENYIAQLNAQKEIMKIQKASDDKATRYLYLVIVSLIGFLTKMTYSNNKFYQKYIFYKEQTFLRLKDDTDVENIKALQKGVNKNV